jgi:hypothetical protein
LKENNFPPWTFFTKHTTKFVERLNVASYINNFPFSKKSTTARLIGDVLVPVFKMFHPPSDTAGTHADISTHTTKSLIDDFCRVSLFLKKLSDSTLRKYVGNSHFIAVHDGNVRGAHALILVHVEEGKCR